MALEYTQGYTVSAGTLVTNTNFNLIVTNMALSCGANKLVGTKSDEDEAGEVTCQAYGRAVIDDSGQEVMRATIGLKRSPVYSNGTVLNLASGASWIVDLAALPDASPSVGEAFTFTGTTSVPGEIVTLIVKLWGVIPFATTYTIATGTDFGTLEYSSATTGIRSHIFLSDGLGGLWPIEATLFQPA